MFPKFFRIGLVTCFLSLLSLHPIWADDTEIFYNSASLAGVQPNLLFVLDASNSMDWYDCQDGTVNENNSCDDGTPNGTNSRRDRMVEAMKLVLDNTKGVNVGMMRLGGFDGARMMYPLRDIEANACLNGVCDENTIFDVRSVVSSSEDDIFVTNTVDGEEIKSDANQLQLAAGDSDEFTALRFQNLVIPKGATIEDARILFTAAEHKNVKTDLKLAIEQTDYADPLINGVDKNKLGERDWGSDIEWPGVRSWVKDRIYESPDISTLIQQVVDEDDWCGSNAVAFSVTGTGDRKAWTYDKSASKAPNIPSSGGCTTTTKTFLLDRDYADGTEDQFGVVNLTNDYTLMKDNVLSGIQFLDVVIDPDAKIRRANLTLKTAWGNANNQGAMDGELWMEDSGDPDPFALSQFNMSSRTDTDKVSWSVREKNGTAMTSPDISSLIQDVISNDDWKSGNSMSFFFNRAGGDPDSLRSFNTFNKSKLNAPRLTISYQTTVRTALDMEGIVRTKLKNQLDDFETILGTPTVGALEEAWRYYAGEPVKHGVKRPFVRWAANQWFSRVSHPETYTGGTVKRSEYCHDANLNSEHCESEEILGNPVYTSPIEAECQSNYIVLLTDGAPWVGNETEREPYYSDTIAKIQGMNGGACVGKPGAHSLCGEEMSKYMFEQDVASHITGDQSIITHSIGFNIKSDWIKDVATAGGGSYYAGVV